MDNILYLNSRVNQISVVAKASSQRLHFAQLQRVLQQVYTMLASVARRKIFSVVRVNLQLLKLQFPLRRSYLHLNLHFRSSHHLQLLRRTCAETVSTQANTMLDSSCVGTETIPESVSVHTRERWFRCDLCNGAKLRGLNYFFFLQGTNEICSFFSFLKRIC